MVFIDEYDTPFIEAHVGDFYNEVKDLLEYCNLDFNEEVKEMYDGYQLTKTISTFSPRSVIASITAKQFGNYWTTTKTYEALQIYIDMNFDGLKDDIIRLLNNEK